jgi:aryl-alcohol dehydrogenase-like predicted oxidoreductase
VPSSRTDGLFPPRSGAGRPPLGLGTAPLAGLYSEVGDEQALATIEVAYELGVRVFDTAPLYGHGLGEARLGQALGHRERDFVLSTKVGRLLRASGPVDTTQVIDGKPLYAGTPSVNPVIDFSAAGVRASLDESRARLGIDEIDLVYIHDPDLRQRQAIEEAYPALARMRDAGEVRAIGVGVNQHELLCTLAREGDFDYFLLAGRYTLLDSSAAAELLPLCLERGIGVIAAGVFNSGVLATPERHGRYDYRPASDAILARVDALKAVCRSHGVPLKAAALQFPAAHPAIVSVVVGARSGSEIRENAAMYEFPIPGGLWRDLKRRGLIPEDAPVGV